MATFSITIITKARHKPTSRTDDVRERAAIQQALLQVVGAVSNTGAYSGSISGGAATGEFSYHCDEGRAA